MGAIGEDGIRVLDQDIIDRAGVTEASWPRWSGASDRCSTARLARYRRGRDRVDLRGRTAIVVDDGVATGSTARVACRIARGLGASRVVLAVPVGPPDTLRHVPEADAVVAVDEPEDFRAVGFHYRDFSPTVRRRGGGPARPGVAPGARRRPAGGAGRLRHRRRVRGRRGGPAGPPAPPRAGRRRRGLRPRQRQQPAQPPQPVRRRRALRRRHRHVPPRPADARTRSTTGASCSTSTSWPAAVGGHRLGAATRTRRRRPGSATSAPAPGPPRPSWRRRTAPGSVAAVVSRGGRPDLAVGAPARGDRTDAPDRGRRGHGRPRRQPEGARRRWAARSAWRSSRGPATSSRNRGRSPRRPSWPGTGSPATCSSERVPA